MLQPFGQSMKYITPPTHNVIVALTVKEILDKHIAKKLL